MIFLSKNSTIIWGMLHLPALPGSPNNIMSISDITKFILTDIATLYNNGITNVVLENLGDVPFYKYNTRSHIASFMTRIGMEITNKYSDIALGVNILRNDAYNSLAVAKSLEPNGKFIRVNVLSGAYVTDQGIIEGEAADILRYRREISAESIEIWADVNVKHASPLVTRPIEDEILENLERAGASKIILTGSMTGKKVDTNVLENISLLISREKIVIGSGVTSDNISEFKHLAKNLIVGSSLKKDNVISNPIDKEKVKKLLQEL